MIGSEATCRGPDKRRQVASAELIVGFGGRDGPIGGGRFRVAPIEICFNWRRRRHSSAGGQEQQPIKVASQKSNQLGQVARCRPLNGLFNQSGRPLSGAGCLRAREPLTGAGGWPVDCRHNRRATAAGAARTATSGRPLAHLLFEFAPPRGRRRRLIAQAEPQLGA